MGLRSINLGLLSITGLSISIEPSSDLTALMVSSQSIVFASAPRQLEQLLARELESIGVQGIKPVASGVQFSGDLRDAMKVCLWSRVANRVLYPVNAGRANNTDELYALVQSTDWSGHLAATQTLAVDFFCANSSITHSLFGALRVKDAIVDQFREATGVRPSVDRKRPDVRINVYLFRNRARIAIDLSGESLHRRGYRSAGARAPLKENLAAALLLACDWPARAGRGESFFDPLCGSGTLLIEAAMIASNTAPGLLRDYFGFFGWLRFDAAIWQALLDEAHAAQQKALAAGPRIGGSDLSQSVVESARENVSRAGFTELVQIRVADIRQARAPTGAKPGLVLSNPPYGVRVNDQAQLGSLYTQIGQQLRSQFPGWCAALFTGAPGLLHRTRLPLETKLQVDNGGLPCKLAVGRIPALTVAADENTAIKHVSEGSIGDRSPVPASGAAVSAPADNMFANRLRKNLRTLKSWLRQHDIHAFRLYDADMPEYAVAVDVYDADRRHVVVQEYQAPSRVDEKKAAVRLQQIMATLPEVLGCDADAVHLKVRKRQKGAEQYTRASHRKEEVEVMESGCRLLVNFDDYLDTGLFLDHRKMRNFIQSEAGGKRFLNLFAYTGAATVHALRGGARSSLTIDLSNTYTAWAERNIRLNDGDPESHRVVRADCLEWLAGKPATDLPSAVSFDLVLLDPPTFSNSARMDKDWDVQRDHVALIDQVMQRVSPSGLLIFSNNFRRFRLASDQLRHYQLENRTDWSLDRDFQRKRRIHQCWFIRHA